MKQSEMCSNYGGFCKKEWVGLTDDEIDKTLKVYEQDYSWISFAKAIEAKLKQKNGFAEEKNT